MGDSYDRVQAKEEVEGLMERAKIICRMETVSSKGAYGLKQWYPLFMHIVEAAAEDDSNMPKEFGITGRVRQDMDRLRAEMTDMVQQTEERLSSQIESIHTMLE